MGALRDARQAAQEAPAEFAVHHQRFAEHLAQLELVAPSFIAHRRLHRLRGRDGGHPGDAIDALRACAEPMAVIAARESNEPSPEITAALRSIGRSMLVVRDIYAPAPDHPAKSSAEPRKA